MFDVGVRVMLWLWLFYMLGHMCANIFLKYLLDICVFFIRVNYPFALSGVFVLSFALRCKLCSVLPLVRAHRLVP